MDSEEDFYYSSDDQVGSEEEDFYYNGGGDEAEDEKPDCIPVGRPEKHYKILTEEDIRQRQDNDISSVSNVLSVSRGLACSLLCQNKWNLSSVYDEWFANEEGARGPEPVGILEKPKFQEQVCKICYENFKIESMVSAACGHPFCADCLKTYITMSINDGPGCLTLFCPEPACKATVGLEMVDSLVSADDKQKYCRFLYRSYIECSRKRKWCPAPGCDFAVEFEAGGGESYNVSCDCSYKFCWNCTEESHRPVDCKMVAKWIEKNTSEAGNSTWIRAYAKHCPKCNRPVEKNQGCNHITCGSPCGHQFCWACLEPWLTHSWSMSCNKYDADYNDRKTRETALRDMERYTHYYERWDSNDKSLKRALLDLNQAKTEHIEMLSKVQKVPPFQLLFVTEAWDQIVECMRVLKWTHAYGYYMSTEKSEKMINYFGYLQGEAESALERLRHCVEKEMGEYLLAHCPCEDFKNFRGKLIGLTAITRNYFDNLVKALENDLSELENKLGEKEALSLRAS